MAKVRIKIELEYELKAKTRKAAITAAENVELPKEYVEDSFVIVKIHLDEKDAEPVDIIASGYEWVCPDCDKLNKEIEVTEKVACVICGITYKTNSPEHALE